MAAPSTGDRGRQSTALTVVFCLPGSIFSGRFLECWTNLVGWCLASGIRPVLSRRYSCNIYYVRNMCLGADVSRGKEQKPFEGTLDYDYIMWIDSDILFAPEQFARLLSHQREIVSGVYLMEGGGAYATVKDWDEDYFAQHGHFRFLRPADVAANSDSATVPSGFSSDDPQLLEVSYTGMGFMLVKKGVFESLEYPWFRPIEKRIGEMVDFTMEDVSFCLRARERGYRVLVDTAVRVGHMKSTPL